MSLISEELLISHHQDSDSSSNIDNSLTAKLDNILHSSDEIIVENTDFFKNSSNELTAQEAVHSPSHSEGQSVPKLEIEDRKRSKYKSGESYTSLGTVVRHETPKIGQKKPKPNKPQRPSSANPSRKQSRSQNNSQKLASFLLQLVKRKPEYAKLIKENKEDFEKLIKSKIKDYEKIEAKELKASSRTFNEIHEKLKLANRIKEKKREAIRVKFEEEELERMRKSFTKFEENCFNKLKFLADHSLKEFKCRKKIEDLQFDKEKKKEKRKLKLMIIENIRNYYDDRMRIFREKLSERRSSKVMWDYEQKNSASVSNKIRKQKRREVHEQHVQLLQKRMENTRLEFEIEQVSVCNRIIQQYKNTSKSQKPCKSQSP